MDKKTVYNKPRKQNYVLIYPGLWNIHLIKDVGMIPFTMAKSFNYNACILTYDNDNYKYLQDHLKDENFSLNFLKKRYKNQRYRCFTVFSPERFYEYFLLLSNL